MIILSSFSKNQQNFIQDIISKCLQFKFTSIDTIFSQQFGYRTCLSEKKYSLSCLPSNPDVAVF